MKEIHERFFQMEQEHRLFDVRTNDDLPVWEIIRYLVYYSLVFDNYNIPEQKTRLESGVFKGYYGLRSLFHFIKILFGSKINFQFGSSRTKNIKGEFHDPYFDSVKSSIKGEFLFYESVIDKKSYSNDPRIFDVLPLLKNIYRISGLNAKRFKSQNNFSHEIILNALEVNFDKTVLNASEIDRILNDFRIEYHHYKWLLKFKKIKRIFVTQNGIQKALFMAAKDLRIPSFEFQHGDIVDSTILYNYGTFDVNVADNLIYPDFLLTFSNLWTQGKFIPSKCIEIGTNFFNHEVNVTKIENTIVIVTSNEQNAVLEKFAFNLAKKNTLLKIYYKLHPAQFNFAEKQKLYFKGLNNIQVVSREKNMRDMILLSNEFVAVYSTAIFEILQAGKTIFILNQLNYKSFQAYFKLPHVHLISDEDDLSFIRAQATYKDFNADPVQFFKPLNTKGLKEAIINS